MQETTIKNYEILKQNIKKEITKDEYDHLINTIEQIDFKGDYEAKCLMLYTSYKAIKKSVPTH